MSDQLALKNILTKGLSRDLVNNATKGMGLKPLLETKNGDQNFI